MTEYPLENSKHHVSYYLHYQNAVIFCIFITNLAKYELSKKFVEYVNKNKTTIPIAFKFVYNKDAFTTNITTKFWKN